MPNRRTTRVWVAVAIVAVALAVGGSATYASLAPSAGLLDLSAFDPCTTFTPDELSRLTLTRDVQPVLSAGPLSGGCTYQDRSANLNLIVGHKTESQDTFLQQMSLDGTATLTSSSSPFARLSTTELRGAQKAPGDDTICVFYAEVGPGDLLFVGENDSRGDPSTIDSLCARARAAYESVVTNVVPPRFLRRVGEN